jgi:hypothetical protein
LGTGQVRFWDLTWIKAERPDMSEITLWNPNKELDQAGRDLATEELRLRRICLVQELDMSS